MKGMEQKRGRQGEATRFLLFLEDVERTTLIMLSAFFLKYQAASRRALTIQK